MIIAKERLARLYLDQIGHLSERIKTLGTRMAAEAEKSVVAARLRRMPGIGPMTAMAIETFAPTMANFRRGRDFAAWLGLVPRQHSTGGKQRLGRTSKMGQRDILGDDHLRTRLPGTNCGSLLS